MTTSLPLSQRHQAALSRPPKAPPDSDRLLVLLVAVLLLQNGASIELILALLYIAM